MRTKLGPFAGAVVAAAGLLVLVGHAQALRLGPTGNSTRHCVVPNVRRKPLRAAKTAVRKHGCAVGKIRTAFSSSVPKGRVVSQSPRPGAQRRPGSKVDLVVSKGPKPPPPHVLMKLSASAPEGTLGAFGSVWVSNHRAGQVSRLDPATGKTLAQVPAGAMVGWPAAGPDAVWALGYGSGTITRIDPTTNQGSTFSSPFSSLCGLPAATADAIWVDACGDTGFQASLDRIDPATHQVTATVQAGNGVDTMVPVGNAIWAAAYNPPEIVHFHAVTGAVFQRLQVSGCPLLTAGAWADGYLWVGQRDSDDVESCTGQPNVLRIDTRTNAMVSVPVGGPAWVTTGDGYVWAAARDQSGKHLVITRIDPSSLATTPWTQLPMTEQPDGFAFIDHALWVGAFTDYAIWVVGTQ